MKGIILAGGLGTRLGELTKKTPKPLLPIRDKPMIHSAISLFEKMGISEIGIIIHEDNLAAFKQWEKEYTGAFNTPIRFFIEKKRAGTFGCLRLARIWVGNEAFVTSNGDCLMDFDPEEMLKHHLSEKPMVTMALVRPIQGGNFIVPAMQDGSVKGFERKTVSSSSEFICSGFQIMEPEIFNHDTNQEYVMIESDIFNAISTQHVLSGVKLENSRFIDCGTVESLAFARESW